MAQEFPKPTQAMLKWSARACYIEGQWSLSDCAAVLNVVRKRAKSTVDSYVKMLKAYTAIDGKPRLGNNIARSSLAKDRLLFAKSLMSFVPQMTSSWNDEWQKLQQYVFVMLTTTFITDPCPEAVHFAAPGFKPKDKMIRVKCNQRVNNVFYRLAKS